MGVFACRANIHTTLWCYSPVPCDAYTVYPKKYAHGFVVLCFVVVMQSFIMNSHEVFIHIHQGCFVALDCHSASEGSLMDMGKSVMYNHNKAQQSKNRVHISWDILYASMNWVTIVSYMIIKRLPESVMDWFELDPHQHNSEWFEHDNKPSRKDVDISKSTYLQTYNKKQFPSYLKSNINLFRIIFKDDCSTYYSQCIKCVLIISAFH